MIEKYLVQSLDKPEFALAVKEYLPFAEKGIKAYVFNRDENLRKAYPLVAEYFLLLDLAVPHHRKNPVIIAIKNLYEKTSSTIKTRLENTLTTREKNKIYVEEFTDYKFKILSEIKTNDVPSTVDIWSIPDVNLESFTEKLIEHIQISTKNRRVSNSLRDVYRGKSVYINDHPMVIEEQDFDPNVLSRDAVNSDDLRSLTVLQERFKRTLIKEGVDPAFIPFLLEYIQQDFLSSSGPSYHWASLSEFLNEICPLQNNDNHSLKIRYDVVKNELHITSEKTYENMGNVNNMNLNRDKIQARSVTKFTIKINKEIKPTKYGFENIEIDIEESKCEIYDKNLRKMYLEGRLNNIAEKIRNQQKLLKDDQRIIQVHVKENKLQRKFKSLNANMLFLLALDNANFASTLLAYNGGKYQAFFARDHEKIKKDLAIIGQKHMYLPQIQHNLEIFNNDLALIDVQFDLRKLENYFVQHPDKASLAMFSITNDQLIKKILSSSKIVYRLDSEILTHFALINESIAKILLNQSAWKRLKVSMHSIGKDDANEVLPCDRFTSKQLTKILKKYPSFWDSFFARKPSSASDNWFGSKRVYRNEFTYDDLQELLNPLTSSRRSYRKSVHKILPDNNLFKKSTITFSQKVQFLKDDKRVFLSDIAGPKADNRIVKENPEIFASDLKELSTLWKDIHVRLTADELYDFYKTKFEQEHSVCADNLKIAIIDLWSDLDAKYNGQKSSEEKIVFKNWPSILKRMILDEVPFVKGGVKKLIYYNKTDLLKKCNPVLHPEYQQYFTGEQYHLILKAIEKIDIVKNALIDVIAQNRTQIINFFIPIENNSYRGLFSEKQYHRLIKTFLNHPHILPVLLEQAYFCNEIKVNPFLARSILKLARRGNDNFLLLKIYELMPPSERRLFLEQKKVHAQYLFDQLTYKEQFFDAFQKCVSLESTEFKILLKQATASQLLSFLVNHQNESLILRNNTEAILIKLLTNCSAQELSVLFNKCPGIIRKIGELRLYKHFGSIIQEAFKFGRVCYENSHLINLMNISQEFEKFLRNLNKLQPSLRDTDLIRYLARAPGQDILKYLLQHSNTVNANEVGDLDDYKHLLSYVLGVPELVQKVILDLDNAANFTLLLDKLYRLYNQRKDNYLVQIITQLLNATIQLSLRDAKIKDTLLASKKFTYYASYFADEILLLSLLASVSKVDLLNDWKIAVNRIAKIKSFGVYLPRLLQLPKFKFLLFNLWSERKLTKLHVEQAQLSPMLIEEIILAEEFDPIDFAKVLINQYRENASFIINCNLREFLLNNPVVCDKMLSKRSGLSCQNLLDILSLELQKDSTSLIVGRILSKSSIGYLLSHDLSSLKTFIREDIPAKYHHVIYESILEHFFERDEFKQKILSTEPLFVNLINVIQKSEQFSAFYLRFIAESLKTQKIDKALENHLAANPEATCQTIVETLDGNRLCDLLLNMHKADQTKMIDCLLNNQITFDKILMNTTLAEKKVEFFNLVLGYFKVSKNQAIILGNSVNFVLNNLQDVAIDSVIQLYTKDGLVVDEHEPIYLFRELIKRDENLNRLFLYATDDQFIQLLSADNTLIKEYVDRLHKDPMTLAAMLSDRIEQSVPHPNNSLLNFVIKTFPIELQLEMMKSNPIIRAHLLQQVLLLDEEFFSGECTKIKECFLYNLIKYENTQMINDFVDKCNRYNKQNFVAAYFLKTFQDKELAEQAIQHVLKIDVYINDNLLEKIILSLPIKEWVQVWNKDNIVSDNNLFKLVEDKFFLQLINNPKIIKTLFSDGTDNLKIYLEHCSRPITFYLYLLEHAPHIGQKLQGILINHYPQLVNKLLEVPARELALILQKECDCVEKPLTKVILSDRQLCEKMLTATDILNGEYIASSQFRSLIRKSETFYGSFRWDKIEHINKYSLMYHSSRTPTYFQCLLFLYALYVRFTRRIRLTKTAYENFWTSVNYFVALDIEGNLCLVHKNQSLNGKIVPPRYCVFYFEAFAHLFFYSRGIAGDSLQTALKSKPKLRELLLQTVSYDKDDNLVFAIFDTDSRITRALPQSYRDAVLYAKCLSPNLTEELKQHPGLRNEFLNSIVVSESNNTICFKNAKHVQVPEAYESAILEALQTNLQTTNIEHLCLICKLLPNIGDIIEQNTAFRDLILKSVYYNKQGQIKFYANDASPPAHFIKAFTSALVLNPKRLTFALEKVPALAVSLDREKLKPALENEPLLRKFFIANTSPKSGRVVSQGSLRSPSEIRLAERKMIEVK